MVGFMVESDEQRQMDLAVEQFTKKATVPVLYDDPRGVDQIGTGTLFTLDGRYFLVTAGHLFKNRDPGRFAIAKGRINSDLHSLGPYKLYQAKEPEFDIAILELQEEATLTYVKSGWRVLELENTDRASLAGTFVLCGYPSARAWRTEDAIGGSLITAFTHRMSGISIEAPPPIHPELDLFFDYGEEAPDREGTTVALPHLRGTSGASVWEYRKPSGGQLWSPERALKIVGVQSASWEGRYFRAKNWAAVLKILRQVDQRLTAIIDAHTNCRRQPGS
jgi:hypothetical protein